MNNYQKTYSGKTASEKMLEMGLLVGKKSRRNVNVQSVGMKLRWMIFGTVTMIMGQYALKQRRKKNLDENIIVKYDLF